MRGDLGDGFANACLSCELIDDLAVNERGVHIKNRQPIGLAARRTRLQRDINAMCIREVTQPRGETFGVSAMNQQIVHSATIRQCHRHRYGARLNDFSTRCLSNVSDPIDLQCHSLGHHQYNHVCRIHH